MTMPLKPVEREFSPELERLATELAKHIKTEQDLTALGRHLLKLTLESALKAELDEHLGYERHAPAGRGSGNSRNGGIRERRSKGSWARYRFKRPGTATAASSRN